MTRTARLFAATCFLTFGSFAGGQAPRTPPPDVAGLWGTELDFGPLVRGQLTIDGRGSQWNAAIGGFEVTVKSEQSSVGFVLPGEVGEFRGHLRPGGKTIVGQWIQPTEVVLFSRYATPVELNEIERNVWRGVVTPNEARISFYVSIQRAGDNSLSAFVRNPEFGWLQRGSYRVESKDEALTFQGSPANNQFTGSFDRQSDQLALNLINGAPSVVLTRRTRDSAVGFFPSTASGTAYTYRKPVADGDGWLTGSLGEVGLDPAPISALIQRILTADTSKNPTNVQALLIARHGKLVLEEYFYGFSSDRPHDMRSAGKTFAPMLVGVARERGADVSPDTPVYSLFPGYLPFANRDDRKDRIRVMDLMSMTAGLDCDEDHSTSAPGNEGAMQSQTTQPDWYKYTLDLPMAHEPGGDRAYYCSAELNLVGGVARKASNTWLPDLFDEGFARPLQFGTYHLNLAPTGEAYMGGGAYVRPRDQLKLGQLYLADGIWNGRRILSRDWIRQSVAVHASFEDRFDVDHQYGWGWHIHHLKIGTRAYTEYEAGGNGGQLVLILPELDMVVGFAGGAYGDLQSWGRWGLELVPQYIISAVREQ